MATLVLVCCLAMPTWAAADGGTSTPDKSVEGRPASKQGSKAFAPKTNDEAVDKRDLNPKQAADLFNDALAFYHDAQYNAAANSFYTFVTRAPGGTENYGWAQFFLGESLGQLGFSYAAEVYYYLVAKTRSQPEVISDTLARLEAISHTDVFDEELLYDKLIYDGDFGVLPPNLSSWVAYVQGLYDYRRNSVDWGDRHFRNIDKDSPYALEALYVRAVAAVRARRDNEAVELLTKILKSEVDAPDVKNRAQLALARMQFEQKEYTEAIASYDKVKQIGLSFEQAEILTEKAWSSYYQQDYARALGLLHALRAPSYDQFFFPESYLLTALIYKDLCHYLAAKNVVRGFRFRFNRTLDQLKQRLPMERIDRVRRATANEGSVAHRTHLLQTLRQQRLKVAEYGEWYRSGLQKHMRALYDGALETHDRHWHKEFYHEADVVALRLLDTVEQMNILDYEISLDIYKPLDDRTLSMVPPVTLTLPNRAFNNYFEFDGEYWNEELDHYRFYINSRCLGTGP